MRRLRRSHGALVGQVSVSKALGKTVAGAVRGTFGAINNGLLFLDPTIDCASGNGNDVTLSLTRNTVAFASLGQTFNQIATAKSIETLASTNPVWSAITFTTDATAARASFDLLSGEIHASGRTALIQDSRFVRDALNDHIRAAFEGREDPAAQAGWSHAFGSWGADSQRRQCRRAQLHTSGGFLTGIDGV